jgi:hypothetical protein
LCSSHNAERGGPTSERATHVARSLVRSVLLFRARKVFAASECVNCVFMTPED